VSVARLADLDLSVIVESVDRLEYQELRDQQDLSGPPVNAVRLVQVVLQEKKGHEDSLAVKVTPVDRDPRVSQVSAVPPEQQEQSDPLDP